MAIYPVKSASELHQRDFVATIALQGLLASGEGKSAATGNKDVIRATARIAYQLADTMIEASEEKPTFSS